MPPPWWSRRAAFRSRSWERRRWDTTWPANSGLEIWADKTRAGSACSGSKAAQNIATGGSFRGSRRLHRPAIVPRKNVNHAPRIQRPGDPANFVLLGREASDPNRPGAGSSKSLRRVREAKARNIAAARIRLQSILPKRFAARWLDLHAPQTWTNQALDQLEREVTNG